MHTGGLSWTAPFRVVLVQSGLCIAEAPSEKEILDDWNVIHAFLLRTEVSVALRGAATEAERAATLARCFERSYVSGVLDAQAGSECSPVARRDSDEMFAFLRAQTRPSPAPTSATADTGLFFDELGGEAEAEIFRSVSPYRGDAVEMSVFGSDDDGRSGVRRGDEEGAARGGAGAGEAGEEDGGRDVVVKEGWLSRLRTLKADREREGSWLRRYFVLTTRYLFEFTDETLATYALCHATHTASELRVFVPESVLSAAFVRELRRDTSAAAAAATAAGEQAGAVPGVAERVHAVDDFMLVQEPNVCFRPVAVGARIVYAFTVVEPGTGTAACFATDRLQDFVAWITFFHGCAGLSAAAAAAQHREGWLFYVPGSSSSSGARWQQCYLVVADGALACHRRVDCGFVALAGCDVADCGRDLLVTPPTGAAEAVRVRPALAAHDAWLAALRSTVAAASSPAPGGTEYPQTRDEIQMLQVIDELIENDERTRKAAAAAAASVAASAAATSSSSSAEASSSSSSSSSRPFVILAIDGGGMRGIISAIILERLAAEFPDLLERVSLFAGTSNGAILASSLAFGYTPLLTRNVLEAVGKYVFTPRPSWTPGGTVASKFTNRYLHRLLTRMYRGRTLADAPRPLVVTAFQLDSGPGSGRARRCCVRNLHNLRARDAAEECGARVTVVDAVMRSTAAPTYFPSWQGYVDGGMYAQDPSSVALALALSPARGLAAPLARTVVLSVGTGSVMRYYEDRGNNHHDYGMAQWAPHILNVLWDSMVLKSADVCRELLGDRYWRVDPDLATEIPLDDVLQLPVLVAAAQAIDLTATFAWVRRTIYGIETDAVPPSSTVPQQQQAPGTAVPPPTAPKNSGSSASDGSDSDALRLPRSCGTNPATGIRPRSYSTPLRFKK